MNRKNVVFGCLVVANVALSALAIVSYRHIEGLQERILAIEAEMTRPAFAGDTVTLNGPGWETSTERLASDSDRVFAARIITNARLAQEAAKEAGQ